MVAHVTTDGRAGVGVSAARAVAHRFPIAHVTVQEIPEGHVCEDIDDGDGTAKSDLHGHSGHDHDHDHHSH
jgi:hypothetical protein